MTYKHQIHLQMENLKPREEKRLAQVTAMKKKTLRCPFQTEGTGVGSVLP